MNLFCLKFVSNKTKRNFCKAAKTAFIAVRPEYTFRLLRIHLQLVLCLTLVAISVPSYAPMANAQTNKPTPRAMFMGTTTGLPKNVILLIGDGMGEEHIMAASIYANGTHNRSVLESAPYQAKMKTHSANSSITDSAAAATAMATGQKVNNGVVSVRIPGDGQHLETALEYFRDRCKSTGIVSTSVINHATPAAFASHSYSRVDYTSLLKNYFQLVLPTVIMGGGPGVNGDTYATDAGYTIVSDRSELEPYEHEYQLGMNNFYDEHPHLSEMTSKSLELLEDDEEGFFLLVEGSRIDHAHETGGLLIEQNLGVGVIPSHVWATTGHTAADVNVYAWGPNAEYVTGRIDNTDIYSILTANNVDMPSCAAQDAPTTALPPPQSETSDVTLRWQTESEANVSGFQVMRSVDGVFDHSVPVTADLIPADGSGSYEYTDSGRLLHIDYTYWLVIVSKDGATTITDQVDVPRSRYINFVPLVSM